MSAYIEYKLQKLLRVYSSIPEYLLENNIRVSIMNNKVTFHFK